VAGTVYFVIRLTDSTFQLAATPGGAAIDLTVDGISMIVAKDLPFAKVLELYSRLVDSWSPAHLVPFTEPYPTVVVATVSELSARRIQLISGVHSESMTTIEEEAMKRIEQWGKGQPLRDATATPPANLAVVASSSSSGRNWGCGGRIP